jgi:ribosomal protein S18 acetylase RimI-like enzyme
VTGLRGGRAPGLLRRGGGAFERFAVDRRVAVRPLARSDRRAATRLLRDAFLDEPLWRVVGPAWRPHRRAALQVLYRIELGKAHRWGGPSFAAEARGALAGVAITFDAGRWPPPQPWATLRDLPSLLLAGPLPALRAGQVDWAVERLRPREPHVYLYLLGVSPLLHRRGVGAALVEAVVAHAFARGLPVCLETMSPSNPRFYAKQGFEVFEECELVGGGRAWMMRRDP